MAKCKDCVHVDVCELDGAAKTAIPEYCALYKDRSRFVELPKKVYIIEEIILDSSYRIDQDVIDDVIFQTYCGRQFSFDEIGKTVFLTKEEAEAALKERETK